METLHEPIFGISYILLFSLARAHRRTDSAVSILTIALMPVVFTLEICCASQVKKSEASTVRPGLRKSKTFGKHSNSLINLFIH